MLTLLFRQHHAPNKARLSSPRNRHILRLMLKLKPGVETTKFNLTVPADLKREFIDVVGERNVSASIRGHMESVIASAKRKRKTS